MSLLEDPRVLFTTRSLFAYVGLRNLRHRLGSANIQTYAKPSLPIKYYAGTHKFAVIDYPPYART